MHRGFAIVLLLLGVALSGCAPRLVPPFADFASPSGALAPSNDVLEAALAEAGWSLAPSASPPVISSAPRPIGSGLFSQTTAALDLLPLSGGTVRVLVRAERRSVLGGRTKIFALTPALQEAMLGSIRDALRSRGLVPLVEARRRDEEATTP